MTSRSVDVIEVKPKIVLGLLQLLYSALNKEFEYIEFVQEFKLIPVSLSSAKFLLILEFLTESQSEDLKNLVRILKEELNSKKIIQEQNAQEDNSSLTEHNPNSLFAVGYNEKDINQSRSHNEVKRAKKN